MSACSGRNYNFRCINVDFWRVFARVSAYSGEKLKLTLAQIREKLPNDSADWHQIWHTCTNSYGNGYRPNKLPLETQGRGHLGGFRGSTIQKSGKLPDWHQRWLTSADSFGNGHRLNTSRPSIPHVAVRGGGGLGCHKFKSRGSLKRLDRLATNVAHICRSIWEWMYAKQIAPLDTRGIWGVLGGQTFKSLGKLSNGWTDWHHLWFTSADLSGNGHRLHPSRPSIPHGALGGGGRGSQIQRSGKLSNGCTDWHQIWYKSADSSGNGHRLNTIRPTIPQGHGGGGV